LEELDGTLYELRPEHTEMKGFVQAVIDWEEEEKLGSSNSPQMASAYAAYEEKKKVSRANIEQSMSSALIQHHIFMFCLQRQQVPSLLFESTKESNLVGHTLPLQFQENCGFILRIYSAVHGNRS
jgi:hypothetical protein